MVKTVLPSHTSHHFEDVVESVDIGSYLDPRCKIIVPMSKGPNYIEVIEWLNKNSNMLVDVKILEVQRYKNMWIKSEPYIDNSVIFIGFENSDDALFFKIKYSTDILD